MSRLHVLLIFILAIALAGRSRAAVVDITLAGLPIDSSSSSFVDPQTGAAFSDPVDANNNFIVDFWNSTASLPDMTPGLIVSGNGFTGNGAPSLPYNFGFTITLPQLADAVSAIMAYSTNPPQAGDPVDGTVLVQGFGPGGVLVASDAVQFTQNASFFEQPISIISPAYDIGSVTISTGDVFDAFGQVTYTAPEPSSAVSLIFCAALVLPRRSQRADSNSFR